MRPPKWWVSSRTILINALALIFVGLETQLHIIQPLVPVNVYLVLAIGLPVVNFVLRAVTTKPVSLKRPQEYLS